MWRGFGLRVFLLIAAVCIGAGAWADDPVTVKLKAGEEVLVAKDISDGGTIYTPVWCGNNAILFRSGDVTWLLDFTSKKKKRVSSNPDEWPLNCTPDGKWAFYNRYVAVPNPTYEEYEGTDENPYTPTIPVMEVYGYEVVTGWRQKFAAAESMGSSDELVSPDGKQISLKPGYYSIEAEAGAWPDAVWFSNKAWDTAEHAWFKDSSGMVAILWGPGDIGVEFFGKDGRAATFEAWPDGASIGQLKVDWEKRIYFTVAGGEREASEGVSYFDESPALKRCSVKSAGLVCENILEHEGLGLYEILPDGGILFQVLYEDCIRGVYPGATDGECVIGNRHGQDVYDDVSLISVSPDKRRLAFVRLKETQRSEGKTGRNDYLQYDIFLIDTACIKERIS